MQLIYLAGAVTGAGLVNHCTGAGLCAGPDTDDTDDDVGAGFDCITK